jgi:hypothetical protein
LNFPLIIATDFNFPLGNIVGPQRFLEFLPDMLAKGI